MEILLTYDEFLKFTVINERHYCGSAVTWSEFNISRNGSHYNLDRKDPNVGYVKSNCVVCCHRCNRAKSNLFTYEEWVQVGAFIRSWTK
jgi:hypothetical protein